MKNCAGHDANQMLERLLWIILNSPDPEALTTETLAYCEHIQARREGQHDA